jgi:hypothetical protein
MQAMKPGDLHFTCYIWHRSIWTNNVNPMGMGKVAAVLILGTHENRVDCLYNDELWSVSKKEFDRLCEWHSRTAKFYEDR